MEQSMENMKINETQEEEEEITIYMKINKTVALRVKESDSIGNVKSLLHDKEGIPECLQQIVSNNGVELTDDQKLVDKGVIKNSLLHAYIDDSVPMLFLVKRLHAVGAITVYSRISDTIQDVKYRIGAIEGLKSEDFSLTHDGRFLEDRKTLAFYKIDGGSMIHMVFNQRDKLLISVVMPTEDIVRVEVEASLTVRDIIRIVENRVGYSTNGMDLFLGKQKLDGSRTLYQYRIDEESVLQMKRRRIQIFVKTSDGTVALDVHRNELVKNVKLMLLKKIKIPVHLQKLIYEGKRLADSRDLASYNITKESRIIFDVRCPVPANIYNGSFSYFMSYKQIYNVKRYHQTSKRVVPKSTSVGYLKTLIKNELKLHVKELYLRGKALNDLCCLGKYGITKKKELVSAC